MNATKLLKQALTRMKNGTQLEDLPADEFNAFVFTNVCDGIVMLAKRFKCRPLEILDDVEKEIVRLQKLGYIEQNYGDDDDDDLWF